MLIIKWITDLTAADIFKNYLKMSARKPKYHHKYALQNLAITLVILVIFEGLALKHNKRNKRNKDKRTT